MTTYISQADTNKMIRKVLKETFPGIKFSVRGSGGSSTNIGWTDGPNKTQVENVIGVFEGSYFDGMIDYKGSRFAWLNGEEVSFGADFIFYNRDNSKTLERKIANRLIQEFRLDELPGRPADVDTFLARFHQGDLYNCSPYSNEDSTCGPHSLQSKMHQGCAKQTFYPFSQSSPTRDTVKFKGDDGYGAGCVGRDGNGEGYGGYPRSQG